MCIYVFAQLKLYHARHADVNVKSYRAYIALALVVLVGAGTAFHGNFYFKVGFTVCHLLVCIALSVDIYYMGQCEWKNSQFSLNLKKKYFSFFKKLEIDYLK